MMHSTSSRNSEKQNNFKAHPSASRVKAAGARLLAILFWLAVWQIASMAIGQEILLVSPVEAVKKSLLASIARVPMAVSDPAPMARVNSYKESSIEYVVRAWCKNADYWDVYFDLTEEIKSGFDRDGIEMTYNHLNVHMMER